MKIITYNTRGLGRGVKWVAIRIMLQKERVDMLCIQETKKKNLKEKLKKLNSLFNAQDYRLSTRIHLVVSYTRKTRRGEERKGKKRKRGVSNFFKIKCKNKQINLGGMSCD